jgi:hypothetical protein
VIASVIAKRILKIIISDFKGLVIYLLFLVIYQTNFSTREFYIILSLTDITTTLSQNFGFVSKWECDISEKS